MGHKTFCSRAVRMLTPLLLILPLYPSMNFASDQHDYEGSRSSIIGPEAGCETIGGDKCVFPFTYQGRMYFSCTGDDSDNGAPWCAVQVRADASRTVLRGKWEDCSPECPGYDLSANFCRYRI